MKSEIRKRPDSKQRLNNAPISRHVNTQQAVTAFEEGKNLQQAKQWQKAIEYYLKATLYDANFYKAHCNIGACYRSLGKFNDSRKYYRKAITINPDDPISRYNLGNVQRLTGNIEQSIEHYRYVLTLKDQRGIDIGSLYTDCLSNLGISLKAKGLLEEAAECYQKVLGVSPSDASAYFNYGMCLVRSLDETDQELFQQVTHEQAAKALSLFKKTLQLAKDNQMAEFQALRMENLLNNSKEGLGKTVADFKKLLSNKDCTLKDEINIEIAKCMKLLKDLEASDQHFRQSVGRFIIRKKTEPNIYDGQGFTNEVLPFTEALGLQMIEDGLIPDLIAKIAKIQENDPIKAVLELTLELTLHNEEGKSLDKAIQIYDRKFKKGGKELKMQEISLAGHKAIGTLLSLQHRYNQSIKHFQYVGKHIQDNKEKSQVHSSLGVDYQAMGDRDRAVEEYKLALESQPNSFELNYNIGCCFYDEQNYQQALHHYHRFLQLIKVSSSVRADTKSLYIADCLISIAACRTQMQVDNRKAFSEYKSAWQAVKEVAELNSTELQFQQGKIMTFYLQWADLLQQKLEQLEDHKSEDYISLKETLLEVYVLLLQNPQCPDRDVILNNCATIYYEEGLFINALVNMSQVSDQQSLSSNNLALTYLHLHEHYMATKHILRAAEDDLDILENFNKQVIAWIYQLEEQEHPTLIKLLPNSSDLAMPIRLEYGKLLLDIVTRQISPTAEDIAKLQVNLNKIVQTPLVDLVDSAEQPKVKALTAFLRDSQPKSKEFLTPRLVSLALQPCHDLEKDFESFIKEILDEPSLSHSCFESLLNLFLFTNRSHKGLGPWLQRRSLPFEKMNLQLDRRVTIEPQLRCRSFGEDYVVKRVSDLIAQTISWESELQSKIVILLKTIEKYYYKSTFRKPLEYEFELPRHGQWQECALTYNKIVRLVLEALGPDTRIQPRGSSLRDMTRSIYSQLEDALGKRIKAKQPMKLQFGDRLTPLSVYAYFSNQQEGKAFLKALMKESSKKQQLELSPDCRQLRVTISGVLRLVCSFQEVSPRLTVLQSVAQSRLPVQLQSLIGLEDDLDSLLSTSEEVRLLLSEKKLLGR